MRRLDKRTNKISDVIDNIKLIKFNSWVEKFLKKVFKSRNKEIKVIIHKLLLWTVNITFMNLNYPVLAITVFLVAIFGAKLSVAVPTALAILQILNSLHSSSRSLPLFIGDFTEFLVSMTRIQNFLMCPEIETDQVIYDESVFDKNAIKVTNANLFWGFDEKLKKKKKIENLSDGEDDRVDIEIPKSTKKINASDSSSSDEGEDSENTDDEESDSDNSKVKIGDKITLKKINLEIQKGEFVAIIGEIGTGKSSIISALIGEMLPVDQYTFDKFKNYEIFDTRHEDNEENRDRLIALNHEVFDRFHYYRKRSVREPIIHVKGSMSLMEQTPWVLNATIRDNILFGEPLIPSKYNKIIEICQLGRDLEILEGGDLTQIGEKGINLSGGQKARIGIARSVYAEKDIVFMDDPLSALDAHVKKKIFDEVLCDELRDKTRILITHAVDFLDRVDKIIVVEKGEIIHQGKFEELKDHDYFKLILDHMKQEEICDEEEAKQEQVVVHNDFQNTRGYNNQVRKSYLSTKGSTITTDENKEMTKADWTVYFGYLTHTKWTIISVLGLLAAIILKRVSDLFFDYYLLTWIKDISETRHNHWDIFGIVLLLTAALTITAFLTALIHMGFIFSISISLFKDMLKRVCYAPVNMYFDITPTGVILNRFSKDIQTVEMVLPFTIRSQLINYVSILSGVAIATYNVVWVLICIPFMVLACYYFLRLYSKALKETSRIESISNSPIITHLGETISGTSTIRAFNKVEEFERRQYFLQDQNVAAQLLRRGVKGWFNTRISIVLTIFMSFAFIYSVLSKGSMNPVLVGLMMVYLMEIQDSLISLFRQMATVDARMVCYERCINMCKIPQEATMRLPLPLDECGHKWVSHGKIEFVDYSAKYRPDAETVLRDLNIVFEPGKKIGVVGRTGAGKSTLCLAICRFIEPLKGKILIDGVDISKVGLADLRDQITVIPQDPAMFENTLRFNLDPDKQSSDEEIMRLINKAGLNTLVAKDPNGLDAKIHLRGDNLSSGEKQLICICRAILRKKRIVIMDEATANIDIHTEKIIQKLIKEEFRESTVLTVAHRLNTIIKSHKILVMSYGSIVEYDEPAKLMNDPDSSFYSLLKEFNN